MVYSDFLGFYPMSFSVPGSHPGHHITFSSHDSLGSSRLWVSRLPLFLTTLTVLKSAVQVFCRICLTLCFFQILAQFESRTFLLGSNDHCQGQGEAEQGHGGSLRIPATSVYAYNPRDQTRASSLQDQMTWVTTPSKMSTCAQDSEVRIGTEPMAKVKQLQRSDLSDSDQNQICDCYILYSLCLSLT